MFIPCEVYITFATDKGTKFGACKCCERENDMDMDNYDYDYGAGMTLFKYDIRVDMEYC